MTNIKLRCTLSTSGSKPFFAPSGSDEKKRRRASLGAWHAHKKKEKSFSSSPNTKVD